MSDYYKLTDANGYTRGGLSGETRWVVGETVRPTGSGTTSCGPGVLHLYRHPVEGQLFNPIHGHYEEPRLFHVQTDAPVETDGLKYWTTGAVCVVEELARPQPLPTLRVVAWSILIAQTCPQSSEWMAWADRWLTGRDRSAWAAAEAAREAAAARATAWAAEWAAEAAREAAAARATAWAAVAAGEAAARAAEWAARARAYPDWIALWEQAAQYVEVTP
jgi:hypothetical protein